MSGFDDLERRLNDASGFDPDVFAAHELVLGRVGDIRRRRRTAATTGLAMCVLLLGTAFAMTIANRGNGNLRSAATEPTEATALVGTSSSSTSPTSPTTSSSTSSTTEPVSTTSSPATSEATTTSTATTSAPENETTTPTTSTRSPVIEPNNGSHVPAPATTAVHRRPPATPSPATTLPPATAEPATTLPETTESTTTGPTTTGPTTTGPTTTGPTTTAEVHDDDQAGSGTTVAGTSTPGNATTTTAATPPADQAATVFSSLPDGNSITVKLQAGSLVLLVSTPAGGFAEHGVETSGDRVSVRFEGQSSEVTITVRIVGGHMSPQYETN